MTDITRISETIFHFQSRQSPIQFNQNLTTFLLVVNSLSVKNTHKQINCSGIRQVNLNTHCDTFVVTSVSLI
jgi:hypothetical protein